MFAEGQKSGRPLTPKRPAFAFLVTPKLPAKRGEVLTDRERNTNSPLLVNISFAKSIIYFVINSKTGY
jgi:hypothetical protein